MKKILWLFCLFFNLTLLAQDYEKEWATVIQHEADGLIKSAAEETSKIYSLAKKDRNEPQLIKAFFFRSKYMQTLEEDSQLKIIETIKKEITEASIPAAAVMESLYAEMLADVYSQNRYSINRRTKTDSEASKNFLTWTEKNFKDEITAAYRRSIKHRDVLYNTPLSRFDAIIETNPLSGDTGRSLYDFLAEQYLNYLFINGSFFDTTLNSEQLGQLFGDELQFKKFKADTIKSEFKEAAVLYKNLEKFYGEKHDNTHLYRSILRRLSQSELRISNDKKHDILLHTLTGLVHKWDGHPFVYRAKLFQANQYKAYADKLEHPEYLLKSLELCNEIIANSRITDAAPEALLVKNSLVFKKAYLTVEKFVLPGHPNLAQVDFKNIDTLTVNIYKFSNNNSEEPQRINFSDKKPLFTKTYVLPSKEDLYEYSTEIILPPLPAGSYAITASDNSNENNAYTTIHVTEIALIQQEVKDTKVYQVVHRETGEPLTNAKFIIGNKQKKLNREGKITVKSNKKKNTEKQPGRSSYPIQVIYNRDTVSTTFYSEDHYRYRNKHDDEEFEAEAVIFTDRAIYRPGQTVYFKGIVLKRQNSNYSTVPNIYVTVSIDDASGKELKSYRLKTNEFGSFSEQFTIPKNVLTGEFSIDVNEDENYEEDELYNKKDDEHPFWDYVDFHYSSRDFKVEEYKRPTFDIAFEPVKDDTRINENATLTGTAKSFSGAPVSGAVVKYKVSRSGHQTLFRYDDYNPKVIAEGTATTNDEGKFDINFIAEADPDFTPQGLPVFTYTVSATVTDVNGETHDATGILKAGYHSLELLASIPEVINAKNKNSILLSSTNLNGEFWPVDGQVSIYKVAAPANVLRTRPWVEPEIQVIPEDEFKKAFPYIPYRSMTNDSILLSEKVYTATVNTAAAKELLLDNIHYWKSGSYEIVFTAKDSAGNEIKSTARFTLKKDTDKMLADNKRFNSEIIKAGNGVIEVEIATALPSLYINISTNYGGAHYDKYIRLTNGKALIKIPYNKEKQDGEHANINIDYIWQNEFVSDRKYVLIAPADEKLKISATSITNKLEPGKTETWSFIIESDRQAVEVVAAMYDKSLDKFAEERWWFPTSGNGDSYYLGERYFSYYGTTGTTYSNYYASSGEIRSFENKLNTFGFNINRSKNIYNRYKTREGVTGDTTRISGIIVDDKGLPIPGVNVIIEGTMEGTQTDFDGAYSLQVLKGDAVTFSFIGFRTQTILANSTNINLIMEPDVTALESAIIDVYRAPASKQFLFGQIVVLEGENLSLLNELQGQVAGLNITTTTVENRTNSTIILRGVGTINGNTEPLFIVDGVPVDEGAYRSLNQDDISSVSVLKDAAATSIYGNRGANGVVVINTKKAAKELEALQQVKARRNFDETAFFHPQLRTDKDGKVSFTFTTPEALTEWKLKLLAHTKNGKHGYFESMAVTQKELMVVPNMPRFVREKDTIIISVKVTNLTAEPKTGNALLELFDAVTMQPVDMQMLNIENMKPFSMEAKTNISISWKIVIPEGMKGLQYRVVAKSGSFTDGEENVLPVLTNNMLVTESISLWVKPNTTREFTFNNMKGNTSSTLRHHGVTLEYTSNPAWTALQSLPYLMEFEHECAEQVFAKYYANSIAGHILKSNPKIAEVFAEWRNKPAAGSKLEKNEELKALLMAETPWLLDAQSEEDNKKSLALLFDTEITNAAMNAGFEKLYNKKLASGGFPWFDGGKENVFITRHILAGLGHLRKLGIAPADKTKENLLTGFANRFIDTHFIEGHKKKIEAVKAKKAFKVTAQYEDLHYLYTRSFYLEQYPLGNSHDTIVNIYLDHIKNNWQQYSLYEKAMSAIVLNRFNDTPTAKKIIQSLKETSASNEEQGMYWIENKAGWYWYRAPIETQALLIEAFIEVDNDIASADAMKVWLLKQKQTKNWPTTKATTEAVYALLMRGSDWLSVKENTIFKLGEQKTLDTKMQESGIEAGTGYIKLNWKPEEVTKDMATLTVENKSAVPGYGGFYWQYFEDLDKIKPAQEGLMNVSKHLYLNKTGSNGSELQSINSSNTLKTGDLVTVRIILFVKEDMEYVHLKDMRAAGFEPVDVLSAYEWKDGLGYYKSTRDVATHFFFDRINKGTYVLEYNLRVNNAGEFSNGITTIQSMYAPEFSGHTKGERVRIE